MDKEQINKILEKIENDQPLSNNDLNQTSIFGSDGKNNKKTTSNTNKSEVENGRKVENGRNSSTSIIDRMGEKGRNLNSKTLKSDKVKSNNSNEGSKMVERSKMVENLSNDNCCTSNEISAEELEKELHGMEVKTNGKPLESCKPAIIPCANDLKIGVKKYTGEYILEEDCCTAVTMILKNDGDLGISFMGAHNLDIVKMIEKNWKKYFKKLKKTLRSELKKHTPEDDIKIVKENNES